MTSILCSAQLQNNTQIISFTDKLKTKEKENSVTSSVDSFNNDYDDFETVDNNEISDKDKLNDINDKESVQISPQKSHLSNLMNNNEQKGKTMVNDIFNDMFDKENKDDKPKSKEKENKQSESNTQLTAKIIQKPPKDTTKIKSEKSKAETDKQNGKYEFNPVT